MTLVPRRSFLRDLGRRLGGIVALAAVARNARGQGMDMMMRGLDLDSPRMTEAELDRAAVEAMIHRGGPVDLRGRGLNGLDLAGLDLREADLTGARLNRSRLAGARLDGAKLAQVWAIEADFSEASLRGADLFQGQFPRARFDRADLTGARLIGNFTGARFRKAVLRELRGGADLTNQSMGLIRAVLRSADLEGADLRDADLTLADMEYVRLRGADLRGARLVKAMLGGADLTGARVDGLDLAEADIASAVLRDLVGREGLKGLERARNRDRAFF